MKKICKKCGIEKTSDEFYLRENRKDNLSYFCIECCKLYAKEYVSNNQEKIKAWRKKHYIDNKEKIKALSKEWHKNNPEKAVKATRKWQKANSGKIIKAAIKWRKENPERSKKYSKEKRNERQRNRIKNNIDLRLNQNISANIRHSLKNNKNGKSWKGLVGYDTEQLKNHLEATMPKGYTWDDYSNGRLQIDHIIPVSIFNITSYKSKGFKACWKLENLRLLESSENRKKHNTLFY